MIKLTESYVPDGLIPVDLRCKFGWSARVSPRLVERKKAMKSNVGRWVVAVVLSIFLSGCSSIRARDEISGQEWTAYPGVQQDLKETGEIFTGKRSEPGWIQGLIASMLIVDLPFSIVFDTLVAPYDVYRIYNPEAFEEADEPPDQPEDLDAE
jgi:uncharacterized protein YceK